MRDSQPRLESEGTPLAAARRSSNEPPVLRLAKFLFDFRVAGDRVPEADVPPEKWKTIGPQGVALLLAIACVEDKTRFARVIQFTNADLAAQIGISDRDLKRVRKRLIAMGWLWYTAGAKNRSGRYRVQIPSAYRSEFEGVVDPCGDGLLCPPGQTVGSPTVRFVSGSEPDTSRRPDAGQYQDTLAPSTPNAVPDAGQYQDTLAHTHTSTSKPMTSYPHTLSYRSAADGESVSEHGHQSTPTRKPKYDEAAVKSFVTEWNRSGRLTPTDASQFAPKMKGVISRMLADEFWSQHWMLALRQAASDSFMVLGMKGNITRSAGKLKPTEFASNEMIRQCLLDDWFAAQQERNSRVV